MRRHASDLMLRVRAVDPLRLDATAAMVLFAIAMFSIWTPTSTPVPLAQTAWAAALAVGVAVRRRAMMPALVFLTVVCVADVLLAGGQSVAGPTGVEGSMLGLLIFYGTGRYLEGKQAVVGLVVALVVVSTKTISEGTLVIANLLWGDVVVALLPWFIGRIVRERSSNAAASRARAERLDSESAARARVAALAERTRLAREIHDVIAHSVSVMVIQTAGARAVMDEQPERAEHALGAVERAGREALAEMRRLLGVLGDPDQLRALSPQPSLNDLNDLIAGIAAAGLDASVEITGEPVPIPAGLGLCAYRVVQEALTNTIKHGGTDRADVRVKWTSETLELEVADAGEGVATLDVPHGGHGLLGMRERTALHGGTMHAGPRDGGGFRVHALIPLIAGQGDEAAQRSTLGSEGIR